MNLKDTERFISRRKVGFVCSVDEEGYPNVKAMLNHSQHLTAWQCKQV